MALAIARQKTNWAAHLYVYLAVFSLGLAMLYLALTGSGESDSAQEGDRERSELP